MAAKVTMIDSPTAQVMAKALQEFEVVDATGRVIKLRKPPILQMFRITEVAGESSTNAGFMGMVLPLIYVTEIDGEPNYQPANRLQLDALITRLGDEGVAAVIEGVVKHFGQQDQEAAKAAVKK